MKEQIKTSSRRQLCAVKVIITQIIVQAHPAQLVTAIYEHVKQAVTLLLVMSLPGIITLAEIQITTLQGSLHQLAFFFLFFLRG